MSKDKKTIWHTTQLDSGQGRRAAADVMHLKLCPTRDAMRNVDTLTLALELFLREPLLIEIMGWTNKQGRVVYGSS